MAHAWRADEHDAELASMPRVVVLYYSSASRAARALVAAFEEVEATAGVPFARADLRDRADPRRRAWRVTRLPTACYYEHGEELDRIEAPPRGTLYAGDLERFADGVDALQPRFRVVRGRLRLDQYG